MLIVGLSGGALAVEEPHIVEVYPNPVTDGDDGEFVTVSLPEGTAPGEFSLADTHASVPLEEANSSDSGRHQVTFSTHPAQTTNLTDRSVRPISDRLQLANDGDTVRLRHNGSVVDEVSYERARETMVYDPGASEWHPLGATERPVVTSIESTTVEAFVLPDNPDRSVELLESADNRILLAGYTLSSQRVVDALVAAQDRGVAVEVLVDDSPVGGMTENTAGALDELDQAGVSVSVSGGERERYRFHHPKYAVVDDRALVMTENWKPSGIGGHSSRGWGVITGQREIVSGLADTFRADTGWNDSVAWSEFDANPVDGDSASETYPASFDAESVSVERTHLLVAPDNAESAIRERIDTAEESIDIQQVRIGDRGFPFLEAVLDAAERGVRVRILLSNEWYVREENEQLAAWLNEQAATEDLPLEVRLADPDGEFGKIHTKGVIIDSEQVVVGSANWNNNSLRNNREVALLLEGEAVAGYFQSVFEADWEKPKQKIPLGLIALCALVALLALLGARQLQFD